MENVKTVVVNRKARHEYEVLDRIEAGIELVGTEVKSIRQGSVNLKDAWADVKNGECFLIGMHISPYEKGNIFNREPERTRKLLLHKKEIRKLGSDIKTKGLTLVPLSLYFRNSHVKVELGICRGKKLYDKRAAKAADDAKRTMDRAIKTHRV
ncbi:SsrA-binding protein SmpB [Ruminococcaceae bacterium OttesenSCG-928-I18]|nr:SsrA-binding protein SmpB [Ruminococcaceae bacterium OttesenSCG-928-I18]